MKGRRVKEVKGGVKAIIHTCDFDIMVLAEVGSSDCCENFQPPLAFRLDNKELV